MSDRLAEVEGVMIDLDGVLYVEDEAISGAVGAVAELRRRELVLRFATNTTSRPRRQIHARLQRLGFDVELDEIVTPAALAVRRCEERGHRGVALLMGDAVKEDFAGLREDDGRIDAVIVGDLGDAFGHQVLNRAFRHVMDGAELIALQKNRYWLTPSGLSLDVGPYVAALEFAASVEALVVGKPAHAFFASALDGMRVPAERAAMVGDDVESDIGGALAAGLAGILVRTGKYREDAVQRSGVVPTAVVDSIADVPRLLGGA